MKLSTGDRQSKHLRRAERQAQAKDRQAASNLLTPQQRVAALDKAFGPGQGAKKERKKLAALMNGRAVKISFKVEAKDADKKLAAVVKDMNALKFPPLSTVVARVG